MNTPPPRRVKARMQRVPVRSSSVVSVGYAAATRTLELEFEGGAVYRYFDVPRRVHAELMDADSKGIYVNTVIKPKYRYELLASSERA